VLNERGYRTRTGGRFGVGALHPERLTAILASVSTRRAERALEVDGRLTALQTEVTGAEEKLKPCQNRSRPRQVTSKRRNYFRS
jgi:hypothetical protein